MGVISVDVIQDGEAVGSFITTNVIQAEVQNTVLSTVVANVSQAAVEVSTPTFLANVVVSPTAPAFPYEGQIWIDVS